MKCIESIIVDNVIENVKKVSNITNTDKKGNEKKRILTYAEIVKRGKSNMKHDEKSPMTKR